MHKPRFSHQVVAAKHLFHIYWDLFIDKLERVKTFHEWHCRRTNYDNRTNERRK